MKELAVVAFSTFASEDLALLAAGALVARGRHRFSAALLACVLGIFFGDLLLYALGRFAGVAASRIVDPHSLRHAGAWLAANGAWVVLLTRFTPGTRLPTYLAAGLLGMNLWLFSAWLLIAALAWTPLLVGLGYFATPKAALPAWLRRYRWEFWPAWAAYLPLIPYLLWLALKHRSLTLFTAANPGIRTGGFAGESKTEILDALPASAVAPYKLIPEHLAPYARIQLAAEFTTRFPVVLKPDVGERGNGVAIVRSQPELEDYLRRATAATIIQEYVSGSEFGLFYFRFPGQAQGRLFSITAKRFPSVQGDGIHTVRQLIARDQRASCLAATYCARLKRDPASVPAPGEQVPLAEIGSHCKGAEFLDGRNLLTPALEAAVERVSRAHPGFYFGRFDVRSPSPEHLRQGMFTVIELNGVTAEATHIYDPAVSVWDAYRTLAFQWRAAFEIGAANRALGARVCTLPELYNAIRRPRLPQGRVYNPSYGNRSS
ncbi:MAG: VTT domain-containing protein [Bryobacterales bacterium]|nr:VTT domain-containing protein [Bryobacterales bacterium]